MSIPNNDYLKLRLRETEYVANQTFNARILSLLKNDQYLDAELSAHIGNVNLDQHTQYVLRNSTFVTDMNTVKTGGMYNALSTVTNGPGSSYSGFILVFRHAATSVKQVWYDFGGAALNHTYEREYTDGNTTWTAWVDKTAANDSHIASLIEAYEYSKIWYSTPETLPSGSSGVLYSKNHGLDSVIDLNRAIGFLCFRCDTAEGGYVSGDIITAGPIAAINDSGTIVAPTVGLDTSSIWSTISYYGHAQQLVAQTKTGSNPGLAFSMTPANWSRFYKIVY